MENLLIHVIIIALMAPLLLIYGLPFIAGAAVLHRFTAGRLEPRLRLIGTCGIAALGIAPSFDIYRQPMAIWLRWVQGQPVSLGYALVSWLVTWLLATGTSLLVSRWRQGEPRAPASTATSSNP